MRVYYNEIDAFAIAWLRALMAAGLIPDGEIDTRSIADVQPDDLAGFDVCHFFAGIGGWPYALRLAGWPDDRPVWTGSCPCQPFSPAGTQAGGDDPRDLWPVWFKLWRVRRPPVVFGEQVETAVKHGWLDRLCADVEAEGYAVGACALPAACVGAHHIRQRLWFVAESDVERQNGAGRERRRRIESADGGAVGGVADGDGAGRGVVGLVAPGDADASSRHDADRGGAPGRAVGDSDGARPQGRTLPSQRAGERAAWSSGLAGELADDALDRRREKCADGGRLGDGDGAQGRAAGSEPGRDVGGVADADGTQSGDGGLSRGGRLVQPAPDAGVGFWDDAEWLPCADGKWRAIEPGTFPLAHGSAARVGRLRGYGNAVVPQVAQVFIEAYLDI